jgi:hypothetical protein
MKSKILNQFAEETGMAETEFVNKVPVNRFDVEKNRPVFKTFIPQKKWLALFVYHRPKTDSGIYMAGNRQAIDKAQIAKVVAVYEGCEWPKEGEHVVLGESEGTILGVGDSGPVFLIREEFIGGVVLPEHLEKHFN